MRAGRYLPGDSLLHRMPAAPKIAVLTCCAVSTVALPGVPGALAAPLVSAAVCAAASLPPAELLAGVRGSRWFLLAIFVFNALFFGGPGTIASWWIIDLTVAGMQQGAIVALRTALVIVLGSVLVATTKPQELVGGIERSLSPLGRLGLPVDTLALAAGITLQFIPILLSECEQLMTAQRARGRVDPASGVTSKIIRSIYMIREDLLGFVRLLVPVFVAAFRRADDLSVAMRARGYRLGSGRLRERGREQRS